jgi:hypothetical protein
MNEWNFGQVLEPSKIDLVEADEILVLEFAETLHVTSHIAWE